jgi:hypothetical protein
LQRNQIWKSDFGLEFDIVIGFCTAVTVLVRRVGMMEASMDTETGFGVDTGSDTYTGMPELLLW